MRAAKKLKNDELLLTGFAGTRLRMELDRVPLWRGDHVDVRQLAEDFARYIYLPRLRDSSVLVEAIADGLKLLTWEADTFAYADAHDESASAADGGSGRYVGRRGGQIVTFIDVDGPGLLVRPEVARRQLDAEVKPPPGVSGTPYADGEYPGEPAGLGGALATDTGGAPAEPVDAAPRAPKRFHGAVVLDTDRVGRDASRIADEVIAHLAGLVGAEVTVTLEVEAEVPAGVPENVVRIVTENSRTLKFTSQGFEEE